MSGACAERHSRCDESCVVLWCRSCSSTGKCATLTSLLHSVDQSYSSSHHENIRSGPAHLFSLLANQIQGIMALLAGHAATPGLVAVVHGWIVAAAVPFTGSIRHFDHPLLSSFSLRGKLRAGKHHLHLRYELAIDVCNFPGCRHLARCYINLLCLAVAILLCIGL